MGGIQLVVGTQRQKQITLCAVNSNRSHARDYDLTGTFKRERISSNVVQISPLRPDKICWAHTHDNCDLLKIFIVKPQEFIP